MDTGQAARFKDTHQFRRQIIHLLKELIVVFIMSEIVVGRRVFVMIGKRDAGYNQIHRIAFHLPAFQNIIVIDRFPQLTGLIFPAGEHPAHHLLLCLQTEQTVLADDIGHLGYHLLMLHPFPHEAFVYLALAFGIH